MATHVKVTRKGGAMSGSGTLHAEWTGVPWHELKHRATSNPHGMSAFAYFLGLIGSATYYIQAADTFGEGFLGVLKALVWPAFLAYEALEALRA